MAKNTATKVYDGRLTEQYLLDQIHYHYESEDYQQRKDRMEDGDRLYAGRLNELFPDENAVPEIPYVENKFKNALHDISRLASEGRGAIKAIPRGDTDKAMKNARMMESIAEGYWTINKMKAMERQLYLDLAGTGAMAVGAYYNDKSPYPQMHRLNPRFCYPDVRNGKLQNILTVENVKERIIAKQFPELELDDKPDNHDDVMFVCYYDDNEVAEAVAKMQRSGAQAWVTHRWQHNLGVVPVAYEKLDSYDGAMRGLFEQLAGPLMVRNKIIRFMVDYMEQTAHAPIFELGVENWDAEPGPLTVYHGDPNAEKVEMRRVEPASSSGQLFGLLQYMGDQEEKEALQPPSRSGNVSQSIASGSFVASTQGQLTSVVKEMQDKMSSFREQLNDICFRIDEKFLDERKPLVRPVAGSKMYTPSDAIDGWYFHEVKFGAGAGLDRLQADARVQNHIAARLISREEGRAEIDYLDDSASSQDKIDRENLADALFQRFVSDPATPSSVIARTWLAMKKEGKSLDEALEETVPDMIAAEQAAQPAQPAGIPGQAPPAEGAPEAGTETAEQIPINLPSPTVQQLFGPGRS